MKPARSYLLAGIVFLLIPAAQKCLGVIGRSVRLLMDRLDGLAFSLAGKLHVDD